MACSAVSEPASVHCSADTASNLIGIARLRFANGRELPAGALLHSLAIRHAPMIAPSGSLTLASPGVAAFHAAHKMNSDRIVLALAVAAQFVLFLRWLYRRVRNDELMRVFVQDMATNHLPHIYDAMHELCKLQGIELSERPQIRWIDLNGMNR